MSEPLFVPADFDVPRGLAGDGFRLEPLEPRHNAADHAAWMSSIAHIRATPGFEARGWPPADGMTAAENLRDLERHADDFARRTGFTYTVLDGDDGGVVGCVYVYPPAVDAADASGTADGPGGPDAAGVPDAAVRSWVRADRAELDGPVHDAVSAWLASDWPFRRVRHRSAG